MPLQNPFSPSRIRRRLSRETLDSDKTSPERSGKFGCRSAAFQMDDEASPRKENRQSPSRPKKRSNRVEDHKGGSSPTRTRPPKSREINRDTPTSILQSSPRCDVREIVDAVSPALPYSKDFGSFDLTLCEADDGRCVVLVEYEDRVFLNGKQIYIMLDGTVTDRDGSPDEVLQRNYDCVLQEKRRLRKTTKGASTNKKTNGSKNSGVTLMHEPKGTARSIYRENEPEIAPSRLTRAKKHASRNDDRYDIITDMSDIEGSFSDIIARLCEAILKYSSYGKNKRPDNQSGGHSYEEISSHVNATLDRLIDQFQSVVELSTSIDDDDARNGDVDDEAIIEKWVAEAFNDREGEKVDGSKDKQKTDDCQSAKATKKSSGVRTVGTQIKERRVQKRDKGGQTELKEDLIKKEDRSEQTEKRFTGMTVEEKLVRELREENRLLQGEICALESEMREMQEQQQELEKLFEAETAAKLKALKELADMTSSKSKNSCQTAAVVSKTRDYPEDGSVSARKNEATSTTSIVARCTISATSLNSLSSVTSSESESLANVEDGTEPGVGMRHRSRALKSEIGRLRNVYSDVEEQLSKLADENTNLRLRLGKMNREAKDVKNQMEQTDQACEEYRHEIKNLDKVNAQLENKLSEMSKEKVFVEEKLGVASNELTNIDVDRRRSARELAELQKKFENLTKEKQHLSQEFGKLEKAHLEASTKSAKLSKTSAESEVQLAILRGQIGDITIEINQLRGENQANSDARQRAERENRKLESELKATRKMNGELSGEVLQIRSKIGALEDTIRHLESDNAQLMQKNVHLEAGKEAFSKRASDAEASNQMISASLKDYEAELYRIKRENFELRTTVEQMNMINTSIRSRLDNWGKDSVDIGKRMKQIVGVKAELQSFIQQLTSVNNNIEERFEKMDHEYADLERKLQKVGTGNEAGDEAEAVCGTQDKNSPVLQELD